MARRSIQILIFEICMIIDFPVDVVMDIPVKSTQKTDVAIRWTGLPVSTGHQFPVIQFRTATVSVLDDVEFGIG